MANFIYRTFSLDTETVKILEKIPPQKRSLTIRNLLKTFADKTIEEEQTNPQQILQSLTTYSDNPSGGQTSSSTPEKQLKEMAHIVSQKRKKRYETPEDGIKQLLRKPSD